MQEDDDLGDGRPRWFVASLERGLQVLAAFGADSPQMSVSDVAERAGISRAAARRFLLTLQQLGYVEGDAHQRYALRPKVLEFGQALLGSLRLDELVMPALRNLTAATAETTNFAVLEGGDVVYLARSVAYRPLHMALRTGDRLPAYTTSLGRVLLAAMSDGALERYLAETEFEPFTPQTCTDPDELRARLMHAREHGYALVADEVANGIVSIAVPVRGRDGEVGAALNLSSQSGRWTGEEMVAQFLEPLCRTAANLAPVVDAMRFNQNER